MGCWHGSFVPAPSTRAAPSAWAAGTSPRASCSGVRTGTTSSRTLRSEAAPPPALTQRRFARALGWGCLGFAGLALARPAGIARLIGHDEDVARALGVRDLGSGLTLLLSEDVVPALLARVAYDVSDAVIFGRREARTIPWALGFAALGVAALRAPRG